MIKSAKDILAIIRDRGLYVRIDPGPPPMPVVTDPWNEEVTPALLEVLRVWRRDLIEELSQR